MGLFLVKERTKQGSAIGGPERFQGMAILLDSYKNGGTTGNFPLVSFNFLLSITYYFQRFLVLFQTERGISIMIQMALTKISENAFLVIETNKNQVFFVSGKFFSNRIFHVEHNFRYLDDRLTVRVDPDGSGDFRKTCFDVEGVILPTGLYLGVTSATGDLTDNHDIYGLKIWQLDSKQKLTEPRNTLTPDVKRPAKDLPIGKFS